MVYDFNCFMAPHLSASIFRKGGFYSAYQGVVGNEKNIRRNNPYQQDKEIDKKKLLLLTVYFFSRSRYNYIIVYLVN